MIYFDNAATTLNKPETVYRAMKEGMTLCANPGRAGHKPSMLAAKKVFVCREEIAELFNCAFAERVVFTYNATYALNFAIKSILHSGGHALISSYEHNSVVRPLEALKEYGVTYTVVKSRLFDSENAISEFEKAIKKESPQCVIINHVSNVFGYELPLEKIDHLCSIYRVPLIVDASQSAGSIKIDVAKLKSVAYICMPGHKGLFGPQGTGIMLACNDKYLYSTIQGGTGSISADFKHPEFLPDVFEGGTLNVPGICGLYEGVKFIKKMGFGYIHQKHRFLIEHLKDKLYSFEGIRIYSGPFHEHGVLAFSVEGFDAEDICYGLSNADVCVRGGIHCSPLAHTVTDTQNEGLIRVSFSVFNSKSEIDAFALILKKILCKKSPLIY